MWERAGVVVLSKIEDDYKCKLEQTRGSTRCEESPDKTQKVFILGCIPDYLTLLAFKYYILNYAVQSLSWLMAYKNASHLIYTKVIYTDLALWVEPNFKSNKMLEYCRCPFPSLFTCSSQRDDTKLCTISQPTSLRCAHLDINLKRTNIEFGGRPTLTSCKWYEMSRKKKCCPMKNFQHHGQLSGCGPDSTASWHLPALLLHI